MKELSNWLNTKDKDWTVGLALYEKYGRYPHLKRQLQKRIHSKTMQEKLVHELNKELSLLQKQGAKKKAVKPKAKSAQKPAAEKKPLVIALKNLPPQAPEDVTAYAESKLQKIRFDQLPDELKREYMRLIDISKMTRQIHWELRSVDDADKAKREEMARKIVEGKDEEAAIWEKLDHYMNTGEILSDKEPTKDFAKAPDIDLFKTEKNKKTYVSQYEKKVEDLKRRHKNAPTQKDKQKLKARIDIAMNKLSEHRADLQAVRKEIESRRG